MAEYARAQPLGCNCLKEWELPTQTELVVSITSRSKELTSQLLTGFSQVLGHFEAQSAKRVTPENRGLEDRSRDVFK